MPIIVKILVSLTVILVINKLSKKLSLSILAGTVVLALWTGQSIADMWKITWTRFWSVDNGFLSLIIVLVIWLSSQMAKAGIMNDLVRTLKATLSFKGSLILLPAVIGLLPMPGGALFSAPLVDDSDEEKRIKPIEKTRINYWFRHIWEYTWPLYPGLILTSDISGLHIYQLFLLGLPMTLAALVVGYFFFLRKIPGTSGEKTVAEHHFLKLILPILIVIIVYAGVMVFFPGVSGISKYLPMTIGLIAASISLQIMWPLDKKGWKVVIFDKKPLSMLSLIHI